MIGRLYGSRTFTAIHFPSGALFCIPALAFVLAYRTSYNIMLLPVPSIQQEGSIQFEFYYNSLTLCLTQSHHRDNAQHRDKLNACP